MRMKISDHVATGNNPQIFAYTYTLPGVGPVRLVPILASGRYPDHELGLPSGFGENLCQKLSTDFDLDYVLRPWIDDRIGSYD
jgi:hypothetical protein